MLPGLKLPGATAAAANDHLQWLGQQLRHQIERIEAQYL